MPRRSSILAVSAVALSLNACVAVTIVEATAGAAIGVTKVAVKTSGKVVRAVIPGGGDEDEKEMKADKD